jgi:hypothetical protein
MGIAYKVWKIAAIAGMTVSFSGCATVNDGSTTIKPSTLSTFSVDENAEVGSRNNPIALGDLAVINDWQVQIKSVNKDALKLVMDSDEYSSPPSSNERFVLIKIIATYIGEESGEPSSDLRFKIVGGRGNTFSKSCSYSVDTFDQNEETFTGATVSGDLCFIVDANQIAGATVSIQGGYSSQDRKFVLIN